MDKLRVRELFISKDIGKDISKLRLNSFITSR